MIFEKNSKIPNIVTANKSTIGIRIPQNKFLLKVIETLRKADCSHELKCVRGQKFDKCKTVTRSF